MQPPLTGPQAKQLVMENIRHEGAFSASVLMPAPSLPRLRTFACAIGAEIPVKYVSGVRDGLEECRFVIVIWETTRLTGFKNDRFVMMIV